MAEFLPSFVADPSLRLFKHKLTTSLNQERNKFYWNTLETFISNTMISHSQAHTCFHFVLRNEELQLKAIVRQLAIFALQHLLNLACADIAIKLDKLYVRQ